jgi:hypothetical protein
MQTLIVSVALLGLAVALSSPTSVVSVLVLLGMPSGLRRAYAFVVGWLATIALIGLLIVVFPALDFRTSRTAPSRAASIAELVIGCLLLGAAVALYRRPPAKNPQRDPMPAWLVRLVGGHWAVAVAAGGVMLTYSLTVVAMLEILKANVTAVDRGLAVTVFALTSILTIAAPIAYATVAPNRAAAQLDNWKRWLAVHSRAIGTTLLTGIAVAIIIKAIHDLAS